MCEREDTLYHSARLSLTALKVHVLVDELVIQMTAAFGRLFLGGAASKIFVRCCWVSRVT
jgi:hypothetical protein